MSNTEEQLQELSHIRELMERSSRYLSLSGLSGVLAGVFAICGAVAAYLVLGHHWFTYPPSDQHEMPMLLRHWDRTVLFIFFDALVVLGASLLCAYLLTVRKARRSGQQLIGPMGVRMVLNLFIPLTVGGVFCLALLAHGIFWLVAPATLMFYGLALINASKYTFDELRYLGMAEAILGLAACFIPGYGLVIWTIGFGFFHVGYGLYMHIKYDRVA